MTQIQESLQAALSEIQRYIADLNFHNVEINGLSKHQLVDFDMHPEYFIMDALTRCINVKKSKEFDQQTTHCAIYFKFIESEDKKKVEKLFISSNKFSNKLLDRLKNIFSLIGFDLVNEGETHRLVKSRDRISKDQFQRKYLETLSYKFSNLNEEIQFYNHKKNSTVKPNQAESLYKQVRKCVTKADAKFISKNKNFENPFQDISLFYFFLNVFVQFADEYFNFENCEIEIIDPSVSMNVLGRHCEVQLVSNFLNQLDETNKYISISSDCCILCSLVLSNLGLEYFGAKNNICSSRFWEFPVFSESMQQCELGRIEKFHYDLNNGIRGICEKLSKKQFNCYNSEWDVELPYSDEFIEQQDLIWQKLRNKMFEKYINKIGKDHDTTTLAKKLGLFMSDKELQQLKKENMNAKKKRN